jgi:hypothetical protein
LNNTKNYPVYDLNINHLITSYFNLKFHPKFIVHKPISSRKRRKSFNKIFVSNAQMKHTNSKVVITLFVFNREKHVLLRKINRLNEIFVKLMLLLINKDKLMKYLSLPFINFNSNVVKNSDLF